RHTRCYRDWSSDVCSSDLLDVWEIVEQVRLLRDTLMRGERVHGVVFQGMGEPLANVERVVEAIQVMCDPSALAIDARAMTVCTRSEERRVGKEGVSGCGR